MRGAYLPCNSTVDVREVADPSPGPGEVVVAMQASTICGSDLRAIYRVHLGHGAEAYQGESAYSFTRRTRRLWSSQQRCGIGVGEGMRVGDRPAHELARQRAQTGGQRGVRAGSLPHTEPGHLHQVGQGR